MKTRVFRFLSVLSLFLATGAIRGASKVGMYQLTESEDIKKIVLKNLKERISL